MVVLGSLLSWLVGYPFYFSYCRLNKIHQIAMKIHQNTRKKFGKTLDSNWTFIRFQHFLDISSHLCKYIYVITQKVLK